MCVLDFGSRRREDVNLVTKINGPQCDACINTRDTLNTRRTSVPNTDEEKHKECLGNSQNKLDYNGLSVVLLNMTDSP